MASKVLKVKLWDGEDGKKWKCNVSDIEGEILCGAFLLVHVHPRLISRHANHHGAIEAEAFFSLTLYPNTNADFSLPIVSQFTLLASTKKGNKPDFHKAAPPTKGKELYDSFFGQVRSLYREDRVKDGVFGAMMDVGLVNDGPVGVDFRCIDEAVIVFHSVLHMDANTFSGHHRDRLQPSGRQEPFWPAATGRR